MLTSGPYLLRPLLPSDHAFLREMLYQSLYVPPGAPPFPRHVLDDPKIARYVRDWGRPGDAGLIALDRDRPVGAAWARLLPAAEPGFGYVDDQTPELGVAVDAEYRGRGIGTALLRELAAGLAGRYPAVSLSVSHDNPALRLYERLGFRIVGEDDGGSLVMIKRFAPPA
ncbi:MAG TPA: GNAT family N-acetyltransferase [Herpetosiphonaceae bacterium]|nr:GNAT family N-acetyltransferase [Herpetosiphonaceae bacterium]